MGGVRRKDGVSLIRAPIRNCGNQDLDVKGEIQVDETIRIRVPKQGTGADQPVVAMKPL